MNNHIKCLYYTILIAFPIICPFIYPSFAGENIWTYSSEGMNGGSIRRLAISPNFVNDQTIFAAAGIGITFEPTHSNGIFKSTDGGVTWTWVFKDIPVPVIDIVLSPNYALDQTIFVITNNFGGRFIGIILKSVDGGINWESIELTFENTGSHNFSTLSAIALSPNYANDNTVFVGSWGGQIFKSTDAGVSYHLTVDPTTVPIKSFAISPNYQNDQTLFADESGGVLKSTDGGETWVTSLSWEKINIHPFFTETVAISPDFVSDSTVFCGTSNHGVYKSTDAGESWYAVNSGLPYGPGTDDGDILDLVVSPNFANDQTIFAVTEGEGVFKSIDGGASWQRVDTPRQELNSDFSLLRRVENSSQQKLVVKKRQAESNYYWNESEANILLRDTGIQTVNEVNVYDLVLSTNYTDDSILYLATYEGVFKSNDNGANWNLTMNGITSIIVTDIEISPGFAADSTIFAGAWQGLFKSTDGGRSWILKGFKGLAMNIELSPDFATDKILFALDGNSLFKSIDAGESWELVAFGIREILAADCLPNCSPFPLMLVISPNYPNDKTLFAYLEGAGAFKSMDDGVSWNAINNGLTSLEVSKLSISPNYANDQTLFAGTFFSGSDGGLFRSKDGGSSWSRVGQGTALTKYNPMIGAISFSPFFAVDSTLFVSQTFISNFIHKSTDGGDTWITVNSSIRANNIVLSPNYLQDQTLYAGTGDGRGIFMSFDGGGTWATMNSGLSTLYAATADLAITSDFPLTLFTGGSAGVWQYTIILETVDFPDINVGSNSAPTFADINNDGKFDLFVGHHGGEIYFFRNIGTATDPTFTLLTNNFADIYVSFNSTPTFADIDNDGDLDLFAGEWIGKIYFFRNISPGPTLVLETNNFADIDVGFHSVPTFVDIDDDGDLDLFVGEGNGNIVFYRNTGTITNPVFELVTNSFSDLDVGENSTPIFVDMDDDGDFDLFVGEESGNINFYRNTGTAANYSFILESEKFAGIDVGDYSAPTIADIDGDGDLDLLVGEKDGGLYFYPNATITSVSLPEKEGVPKTFELNQNYPNPFNPETTIKYQLPKTSEVKLEIYSLLGRRVAVLVDRQKPAGYYAVNWNGKDDTGRNVASGVYFYRLQTRGPSAGSPKGKGSGSFVETRKMLLIR